MRFSLLKKSSLSKAWPVLDSCKHNSSVAHSAYALTTAGSNPSQIDIQGELRDTHQPKTCFSFLFKTEPLIFNKLLTAVWRDIGDTRWALFGPKTGIDFAHFGLISGMVSFQFQMNKNGWFSLDVTKIQTGKLSTLLRFYFHEALEQLKTNFHTNFRFKGFLVLW